MTDSGAPDQEQEREDPALCLGPKQSLSLGQARCFCSVLFVFFPVQSL